MNDDIRIQLDDYAEHVAELQQPEAQPLISWPTLISGQMIEHDGLYWLVLDFHRDTSGGDYVYRCQHGERMMDIDQSDAEGWGCV